MKSLLNISDLNQNDFDSILQFADDLNNQTEKTLTNRNIGLIFEKNSTRTRLSFQVGINQLDGKYIDVRFEELNLNRFESYEDTFEVMSCYLDYLVFRTNDHKKLELAYKFFKKPKFNVLSGWVAMMEHYFVSAWFFPKEENNLFNIYVIGLDNTNVRFKNFIVNNPHLDAKFFKGIDIFVFPSYSEGLGLVLLEAMSYQKICITRNLEPMNQFINENNGYLFSNNNDLKDAILNASYDLNNEKIHLEKIKNIKKVLEIYDIKNVFPKILEVYKL